MAYKLTWRCDHRDGDEECTQIQIVWSPEPSSMVASHIPPGWMAVGSAGDPPHVYSVYCPQHRGEH